MSKAKVVLPLIGSLFLVNSVFAAGDLALEPVARAAEQRMMQAEKTRPVVPSSAAMATDADGWVALDPRIRRAEENVLRLKRVERAVVDQERKAHDAKLSEGMARATASGTRFDFMDRYNP